MKHNFIFLSLLALAQSLSLEHQWHSWKLLHRKAYADHSEEKLRRNIWEENVAKIYEHNDQVTADANFSLAINHFTDLVSIF